MIRKTIHEARVEWGDLIRAVTDPVEPEHVEITRTRGRPADRAAAAESVAVLVPATWHDELPADRQVNETAVMKSSEARTHLREVVDSALGGHPTTITLYKNKMRAVLVVPTRWYNAIRSGK